MTAKLTASLRAAPVTVPALAAIALFVIWATDQAGFPVTHWAPGGLILLGLLGIAAAAGGVRPRELPRPVAIALACLAAYTALSYLSIMWAAVPGDAWEGANRTLVYLLVFTLFAGWPQRGSSAALLIGVWLGSLVGLALFVALHVHGASPAELQRLLPDGRLIYPSGYANANAALWLMAFWPALLLARSEQLQWAVRGALAGGAVLLAEVALLSQSRGSLYATPVMLILVFALLPGRARTFALLVPVAAGIAAAAPAVLRVGNRLHDGAVVQGRVHTAVTAMLLAAVVVAGIVALGAAVESRKEVSAQTARRVRTALGVSAVATLVLALAGGWIAAGDPLHRLEHAWDTFKSPRGYAANSSGSRLGSGLGSFRYDFYRVALDEFVDHPLAGIGADNFQQQYLAHRRSYETPHYPHSVEVRTLSQGGLIGAALALAGLLAALVAAIRACRPAPTREGDPLGPAVAAAALAGFGYWTVHGSFDWFWEFAGLGAPAFALLGIACALTPQWRARAAAADATAAPERRTGEDASGPGGGHRLSGGLRGSRVRVLVALAAGALALVCVASLAAPWLSRLQVESAARIWTRAPSTAYSRLDEAADLNPLSDEAFLVAGSIALRYKELARADHLFARALSRSPDDAYATLERGAIASETNHRAAALRLLARAVALDPREPVARYALRVVRAGRRLRVDELNREILYKGRQLS